MSVFTIKDPNFQDGTAFCMYITEVLFPKTIQAKLFCHVSNCWCFCNIHCDRFRQFVLVGSESLSAIGAIISASLEPMHLYGLKPNKNQPIWKHGKFCNITEQACLMQDGSVWTFGQANRTTMVIRPDVLSPLLHTCRDELDGERGMQVECGEMFIFILTDIGSVFQLRVVDIEITPEDGLPGGIDPDTVLTAAWGYWFYRENQPTFRVEREYFSNMPIKMIASGNFVMLVVCIKVCGRGEQTRTVVLEEVSERS